MISKLDCSASLNKFNNILPDDEDIWFEALTGAPQAAAMLGLGGGGAPHPELAPPGPPAGGGPQPVEPLVSSPPPQSPMTALREPHPVPRSFKERPDSSSLPAVAIPFLVRLCSCLTPSFGMC